MNPSKRKKGQIKQGGTPEKGIRIGGNPDSVMQEVLSWSFADCDMDPQCRWSFCQQHLETDFWQTILPKLRQFETMTVSNIFMDSKKQNHKLSLDSLNKEALDRFVQLRIEAESIHSLRLGGKLRLYGFLVGSVYHIVWYDSDHGDNSSCVCRSHLKHT